MSRILIVEDDELLRESICDILSSARHDTLEAADGEEGLALLKKQTIDLAIVDIWMPKVDGLAFQRQLRASDYKFPVIVVSGGGAGNSLEHATALADSFGAAAVLFKPFKAQELLDAVAALLPR